MTYRAMIVGLICAIGLGWAAAGQEKAGAGDAAKDKAVEAQLERRLPEVSFRGNSLKDVVDFLRDVSGVEIMVDWKMLETVGIRENAGVDVRLRDVKFRSALNRILETLETEKGRAGFTVKDGVVVVSTAAAKLKEQAEPLPKHLDRVMPEIRFNGQPLYKVLDFVRDVSGANIVVNWNALERAGVLRDAGVHLRAKEIPCSVALARILEGVAAGKTSLQTTFDGDILMITTAPPKADAKPAAGEAKPAAAKEKPQQ
jgi:hypothetical protein